MTTRSTRPNIIYFFVDDMGYGDASCLNGEGKIQTPNIDRLAREGMVFKDAHSSSAVCSPSRYSVLTGRYNWRSTLQKGIVGRYGDPLIAEDRLTVPGFLNGTAITAPASANGIWGRDGISSLTKRPSIPE